MDILNITSELISIANWVHSLPEYWLVLVGCGMGGGVLFLMHLMKLIFAKRIRTFQPWRRVYAKKWLKEFRRNQGRYSDSQRFKYIREMDFFLFEEVLITCFEERGYKVIRTKMTRDNGSDGYVFLNDELVAIQAKRYSGPIAKKDILSFERLVTNGSKINKGLFIHTGKTSQPIKDIARNSNCIELISGIDKIICFIDGRDMNIFSKPLKTI